MTSPTESYYPGSSRKRKEYTEPEVQEERKELDDLPDLGKPRYYLVGNQPVELYNIGGLSLALNRKPVTIRKWEAEGVIPVSPYKMPGRDTRGQRRLYSIEHIKTLRQLAYEEDVLYPNSRGKWRHIETTNFKERAAKIFSA